MSRQNNRQPSRSSGRAPVQPKGSSRYVEPQQPASQRRGESVRTSSRSGRSGGGSGKFLAIFLGVIVLMVTVCAVLYVTQSEKKSKAERGLREKERIRDLNIDRAYQAFLKAHSAGKNYVTGADPNATDDQLFGPFRGDSTIYNVVYTRNFKDKARDTFAQKMMDPGRKNIAEGGNTISKGDGVQIKKGKVNGDDPIMTARKNYASDPADKVNQGGEILVIVTAQREPD
jgi:hypothetical protein